MSMNTEQMQIVISALTEELDSAVSALAIIWGEEEVATPRMLIDAVRENVDWGE